MMQPSIHTPHMYVTSLRGERLPFRAVAHDLGWTANDMLTIDEHPSHLVVRADGKRLPNRAPIWAWLDESGRYLNSSLFRAVLNSHERVLVLIPPGAEVAEIYSASTVVELTWRLRCGAASDRAS